MSTTQKFSFETVVTIDAQQITDLVVTAVESGGYGSLTYRPRIDTGTAREELAKAGVSHLGPLPAEIVAAEILSSGVKVTDRYGDGESGTITTDKLLDAISKVAKMRGESAMNLVNDPDAPSADAVMQYAAFGDVIYG